MTPRERESCLSATLECGGETMMYPGSDIPQQINVNASSCFLHLPSLARGCRPRTDGWRRDNDIPWWWHPPADARACPQLLYPPHLGTWVLVSREYPRISQCSLVPSNTPVKSCMNKENSPQRSQCVDQRLRL